MKVISILELSVGGGEEETCLEQSLASSACSHKTFVSGLRLQLPMGALCVNNLTITTTLAGPDSERGAP